MLLFKCENSRYDEAVVVDANFRNKNKVVCIRQNANCFQILTEFLRKDFIRR